MLQREEGDIMRKKVSNVSNLVIIKPKHTNSKIKFLGWKIKNVTNYLQSLLTFSHMLSKVTG